MRPLTAQSAPLVRSTSLSTVSRGRAGWTVAAALGLAGILSGCAGTAASGKIVAGPSSIVTMSDEKDARLNGPGLSGAEAELKAMREGLGDRVISKTLSDAEGRFSIDFKDKLTSETLYLTVSKGGYITARGPVSISAGGKQILVILKTTK